MHRHALVAGANRGLGLAMTRSLVEDGWSVACVARDAERLNAAVDELTRSGATATAHVADVTVEADVQRVFDELAARGTVPRLVVCNAGIFRPGTVTDALLEDWRDTVEVNLTGAFLVARAAVTQLRGLEPVDGRRGHLVFVNSGAGIAPFARGAAYTASKYGMLGLAGALREEVRGEAINVTDLVVRGSFKSELAPRMDASLPAEVVGEVLRRIVDLPGGAYIERLDLSAVDG